MTDHTLGVALLGAGIFATEAHLPALLSPTASISLKAIYSRSHSSAETLSSNPLFSEQKGKSLSKPDVYSGDQGLEEVLNRQDVHAVVVVLPIGKQPEVILKALKAGKHVLSEKPIAKDVESAKELIKIYEQQYAPKGLIWRIAENFAHEPLTLLASSLLHSPSSPLGPILYYQMSMIVHVESGSKYHATEWRQVPDYKGGFLLDGGVHMAAAVRVVLGDMAPTQIISTTSLHRTHLAPHDTIVAIASAPDIQVNPYGPNNNLKMSQQPVRVKGGVGKSSPSGTIIFSFANPESPSLAAPSLVVTCLNGTLTLNASWKLTLDSTNPAVNALLDDHKSSSSFSFSSNPFPSLSAQGTGVKEEVEQFARACLGTAAGVDDKNKSGPRDALWDLGFIQGCLESEGEKVDLREFRM